MTNAEARFNKSHIRKVYACLAVTCHLHFWQNDRDFFTCYCGNTGGGTDTEIRVSTESRPWRRKFSRRSSRDSNPRPYIYIASPSADTATSDNQRSPDVVADSSRELAVQSPRHTPFETWTGSTPTPRRRTQAVASSGCQFRKTCKLCFVWVTCELFTGIQGASVTSFSSVSVHQCTLGGAVGVLLCQFCFETFVKLIRYVNVFSSYMLC